MLVMILFDQKYLCVFMMWKFRLLFIVIILVMIIMMKVVLMLMCIFERMQGIVVGSIICRNSVDWFVFRLWVVCRQMLLIWCILVMVFISIGKNVFSEIRNSVGGLFSLNQRMVNGMQVIGGIGWIICIVRFMSLQICWLEFISKFSGRVSLVLIRKLVIIWYRLLMVFMISLFEKVQVS